MKKIILLSIVFASCQFLNAQGNAVKETNTQFKSAMLANIKQLDTASVASSLIAIANNFERIAIAEKTKWQPFYYASYSYVVMAFMTTDKTKIDWLADKAEAFLQKAESINKNSEITCLQAMIISCRLMVDPVSRFQIMGPEINTLLEKAKQENPDNPRIYLLQTRIQLRTPEAFGGGKTVAAASLKTALEKFTSFKPLDPIDPNWGADQAKSLLKKMNEQ